MDKAEAVNDILIAQSSFGTTYVGRFDLQIDTDKKRIESYTWKRVEINSNFCDFHCSKKAMKVRMAAAMAINLLSV